MPRPFVVTNFIYTLFVALLFFICSFAVVSAQTAEHAISAAAGDILVSVNLSEATLVEDGDEAVISFLVENYGEKAQTDLRFGLEVIKENTDGSQTLIDVMVNEGEVTVSPTEPLPIEIVYSKERLPSGVYQVWAQAQTPGGLLVGIAKAGEIIVENAETLSIDAGSCVLGIAGLEGDYGLSDGVDVSSTEELVLNCDLVNNSSSTTMTAKPVFETYERNIYGDLFEQNYAEAGEVTILPGETKAVELIVPKPEKPQAYDLVVYYTGQDITSNKVVVHYVVQGQSATLHSVNFDKDSYQLGENIGLSILWALSADTFLDSRGGGTKKTEPYYFDVVVSDINGLECAKDRVLVGASDLTYVSLVSGINCERPAASVSLQTSSGAVLDTESVTTFTDDYVPQGSSQASYVNKIPNTVFLVVAIFALIGIILLLGYARRHGNHIVADDLKSLFVLAVLGGGFIIMPSSAEAVTWRLTADYEDCSSVGWDNGGCQTITATLVTATVNTNKRIYAPGEIIQLTGHTQNHSCSNLYYGISARLTGNPELTFFEGRARGIRNFSGTFVAPTTPGNYRIGLGVCYTNARNCASSYIDITVANPAVNGRCSASHYRCSAGNSVSNNETATGYTWRCNGLNGGRNVSCSETKINGSCGAANACTAGSVSGVSQNGSQYLWSCVSPNGGNNASCSAYIPPTVDLTANPIRVGPGAGSDLSWTVTNATSCTASGGWSGAKSNTGGSENVRPGATTVYTLSCTGPGGTVSDSTTITVPSGSLTATGCSIAPGGTGCSSTVRWSSANFLGATHLYLGSNTISTTVANNPSGQTYTVTPTNRTFRLDDVGSNFELIAPADVTCSGNSVWADSIGQCIPRPTISIEANPEVVRSGESANVSVLIDSAFDLTCTLRGGLDVTFTHEGTATRRQTHDYATNPLTAAQITEITCTVDDYPEVSAVVDTRISVVPTIEEI